MFLKQDRRRKQFVTIIGGASEGVKRLDVSQKLVSMLQNFFPSSLMTRPNKLEGLSLETLSSQVLEFEGKAGANPIGAPFGWFLLG
jgi:hypothetical protein